MGGARPFGRNAPFAKALPSAWLGAGRTGRVERGESEARECVNMRGERLAWDEAQDNSSYLEKAALHKRG